MLKEILNKYKSDKSEKHYYHTVYEPIFENYLEDITFCLLEIGIFKGNSISAWLEYFPKARKIIGIDIFNRIDPKDIPILKNERVTWIKGDSTKSETFSKNIIKPIFDIIIDDGMHTPRANADTFKCAMPYLKNNGIYFIEDIWPLDKMTLIEKKHKWITDVKRKDQYTDEEYQYFLNTISGYNIEQFDLRKLSGQPDSYIFKIKFPEI